MRTWPIRHIMLRLLLLVGIMAFGAAWFFWPDQAAAARHALAVAEQRWNQRTFGHYQLNLTDKGCLQQIQIQNERVASVASNRCDAPPRSISDLFNLIRRSGTVSHPCIYQGCACDDMIIVQATYDQQLGFPTKIIVRIHAVPNIQHRDFWERTFTYHKLPNCNGMSEGSKIIQVISITPK